MAALPILTPMTNDVPGGKPEQVWRLAYPCGHRLEFARPQTAVELLACADWLAKRWQSCGLCASPNSRA
jgi:hypothetical protein